MDPTLRALCLEVLCGDVDSDRFAMLLMETGVSVDSYEWEVANNLLKQGDAISSLSQRFGHIIH